MKNEYLSLIIGVQMNKSNIYGPINIIGSHTFCFTNKYSYRCRCRFCNIALTSINNVFNTKCLTPEEKIIKDLIE